MKRALLIAAAMLVSASACAAQSQDSLEARLERGLRAYDAGRRDEAYRIFDTFIDDYNAANGRLTSSQLVAVGIAMRHLGGRDPQLFKDALQAFDEAVATDPKNARAHVELGELFLDKYNSAEARKALGEALRLDSANADALTGLARVLSFDHQAGALDAARKALRAQPRHNGAHAFLTHAFIGTDALDSARVHAAQTDAATLEGMIAHAALAQATGDQGKLDELRSAIRSNSTALSRFETALAELSVQQRQYAEAVRLASLALRADSGAWKAWSVLGINQLRLGNEAAARASLERSFKGDPYNVWVKNTLDLLDRLATFRSHEAGRFRIVAAQRDADVLTPYVTALGEEAFARLQRRYGYAPSGPVRVEIFDRHADFSVRTVGLAGLGALGVSFGNVLAIDAPSARERGEFNWGSTFWHELAHTFHLGMTNQRVPRWFTEGLAVLEERRARAGWGEEFRPFFEQAARAKRLLPLADLNSGFVRPSYPSQVSVSYYQASLVIEMLEQQHGEDVTRALLQAYAAGKSTERALRDVTGQTPAKIDEAFARFVEQHLRTPRVVAEYDELAAQNTTAALENAIFLWPYDIDLHTRLAELYTRERNHAAAVRERAVIVALQPVDIAEARYQLALAHQSAGDNASARKEVLRALESAPNFERAQELLLKLSEAR